MIPLSYHHILYWNILHDKVPVPCVTIIFHYMRDDANTWKIRSKKMNPFRLVTNFSLKLKSKWVVQFPGYHWMWICNSFRNIPGQNCCGWNMGPRATPTSPPSLQEDPRDKALAPSAMSFAYPASTLSTSLGPGMQGNSRKQWCRGDSGCSGGSWWTIKGDDGWGMQPSPKSMQGFGFFFSYTSASCRLFAFPGFSHAGPFRHVFQKWLAMPSMQFAI
jgi:hypothetical protein